MTIKAVLFDHDGTLVDSEIIHYRLWCEVLGAHDVELSLDDYRQHYVGVPGDENARDMVRRFGLSAAPDALFTAKDDATRAYLHARAFPLMPGVPEVLQACRRRRCDLAVVTGANAQGVTASLREHNCFAHFATMVTRDDVAYSKPEPDVYLLALERLELLPSECVAVEDTEAGLQAALAAGLRCVAVPTDLSREQDFTGASARCDSLMDAWAWIDRQD
ncbi:HAD family hydrolase [Paludibacterium purpuratum]|uniref:HAD superfamily hydrolase (TIGR01509 family) n=1 Tax=Paludibacterium purpuratum TaxID=1144873 RepID=A0A4R7B302_9NEIS|nr:HAD family phosphatase [Paludibacterium purpuratum]TDR76544.1 HAD superfamily hydrolase (TIGR01509 family) [Paludibacterium purpuratum]